MFTHNTNTEIFKAALEAHHNLTNNEEPITFDFWLTDPNRTNLRIKLENGRYIEAGYEFEDDEIIGINSVTYIDAEELEEQAGTQDYDPVTSFEEAVAVLTRLVEEAAA